MNASPQAEQLQPEPGLVEAPRPTDWQELQAAGNAAYDAARARERAGDPDAKPDDETIDLYRQFTENCSRAAWYAPKDRNIVAENAWIDLRMARAFAKQAEAIEPGKFLEGAGSSYIDEKSNFQDLALRAQQRYITAMLKGHIAEMEVDSTVVKPIIAKAAIKAAIEAGNGKHMSIRDTDDVSEITLERLEARGTEGIMEFTKVLGAQSGEGLEFIEELTENVETGIHDLPRT